MKRHKKHSFGDFHSQFYAIWLFLLVFNSLLKIPLKIHRQPANDVLQPWQICHSNEHLHKELSFILFHHLKSWQFHFVLVAWGFRCFVGVFLLLELLSVRFAVLHAKLHHQFTLFFYRSNFFFKFVESLQLNEPTTAFEDEKTYHESLKNFSVEKLRLI